MVTLIMALMAGAIIALALMLWLSMKRTDEAISIVYRAISIIDRYEELKQKDKDNGSKKTGSVNQE